MTLGERLLKYRTDAKMSQDTLAEKVGVTRQTISKWETDQSMPEFNKILPLCDIYGIKADELITGKKEDEEKLESKKEESFEEKLKELKAIRNNKKALIISISVFLYIIGTFSIPYMVESLNYDEGHAIMVAGVLWAIATAMLIYFFVANPKIQGGKE